MIELSPELLERVVPHLQEGRARLHAPFLQDACDRYEINTIKRLAAFLSQVGTETGSLLWTEELWGPTKQQKGYEGRADLGNVRDGDGYRYRGRGDLMATGRDMYRLLTEGLGIPFEEHPEWVSEPVWAARTAGYIWTNVKRLNRLADQMDIRHITIRIVGGTIKLLERCERYIVALRELGI